MRSLALADLLPSLLVVVHLVLTACGADSGGGSGSPSGAGGGLSDGTGVERRESPSAYDWFALEVLDQLGDARPRSDLEESKLAMERRYTRHWLQQFVTASLLERLGPGEHRYLSDVGPKKDDAVVVRWKVPEGSVEVVDGRTMIFCFRLSDRAQAAGIIWKEWFGSEPGDHSMPPPPRRALSVLASPPGDGDRRGIAEFEPVEGPAPSRLVHWFERGDQTIFEFEKLLTPPRGKGESQAKYPLRMASNFIGGIEHSATERYLRFEPYNRGRLSVAMARDLNAARAESKD